MKALMWLFLWPILLMWKTVAWFFKAIVTWGLSNKGT